uniref:DNA-directed DNA polymerase family A palm domain-containing protein n=1 Tax=Caulerpa manorensis TaxID=717648 RepID=A0A2P0QI49_9CHLO|nr:hypothetical protein [Caulerpa manorensis]ARO74441.1 hypothetical protein [Caulerpa manorensis]
MFKHSKPPKTISRFSNGSHRGVVTRLPHQPSHIYFSETTNVGLDRSFLPNSCIQKVYAPPIYEDGWDIPPSLVNQLGENVKGDYETPFEIGQFKNQPWWIRSTLETPSRGQVEDNLGTIEENPLEDISRGQPGDNLGTTEENPGILDKIKEIQFGDDLKISCIKKLLLNIPLAKEPVVHIDPDSALLSQLFSENLVISLDTEFTQEGLAYIQIGFLQNQTVCILSFSNNFAGFERIFLEWLTQEALIIGFNMISDLKQLWNKFSSLPPTSSLLGKVFDLYLFLRFLHNGYKHQNSLAAWANRILGVEMEKSLQTTNWFNTPLTEEIQQYLVDDVYILHKLVNFYQKTSDLYYVNSWISGKKHNYLEASYSQDQILIPLFLKMELRGICISLSSLEACAKVQKEKRSKLLEVLGLSLEESQSAIKFTNWLRHTMHPISQLAKDWPKTPSGSALARGSETINTWVTQHTVDPRFQDKDILEWLTNYFSFSSLSGFIKFVDTVKKQVFENKIKPRWNIMGTDTGRITTQEPALQNTPRDPMARSSIIPDKKGDVFVIADYKTIELAIQAVIADETNMLKVFLNRLDLHIYLASKVLKKSYEDLMALKTQEETQAEFKLLRTQMKPVNFGKIYGMSYNTLWRRFLAQGRNISLEETKLIDGVWNDTFPKIQNYQKKCKTLFDNSMAPLNVLGGTHYITSLCGRIRRPEILPNKKPFLNFTQIINFPIQSSCTDFLKLSLRVLDHEISFNKLPAKIVASAHDEIILQCSQEHAKAVEETVKSIMVASAQYILRPIFPNAPIEVDTAIGTSWADKP